MRNPDPETPEDAYEEHNVQFYVSKSGKFLFRKWIDVKNVFTACTHGFEAKVINVVGYSILQVVLDLTALQLMVLQGDIAFTNENIQALALFFFTTVVGAVVAVYRSPIGTTLLIMTQLAGVVVVFKNFSRPLIVATLINFLEEYQKSPFASNILLGTYNVISTLAFLFIYTSPTLLGIWFIYCTVMLMCVLLGFKVYETPIENEEQASMITVVRTPESSTIMETPRSSPAETDYFSDESVL